MNKASGGDGIPAELFQILKDDAVKVLHSVCQQIWKTRQWPQDWKRTFKRRVNSTKQLLKAGRGHQAPRKATQVFERREKKYSSNSPEHQHKLP